MAYGIDEPQEDADRAEHLLWRISEDTWELHDRAQEVVSLTRATQGQVFPAGLFGQTQTPDVARAVLWANLAQEVFEGALEVFEGRAQDPDRARAELAGLGTRVGSLLAASDAAGLADAGVI